MKAEVVLTMSLEDMDHVRALVREAHGLAVKDGMDGGSFKNADARNAIGRVEFVAAKLNVGLPALFVRGKL